MLGRSLTKYVRMSPRKVRFVMLPLKRRTVADALGMLSGMQKRAAGPIAKAIASAFANARQKDPTLAEHQVIISRLDADGGPMWKRFRAAAFGRAVQIRKRTAHIIVELDRPATKPGARPTPPAAAAAASKAPTRQAKPAAKPAAATGRKRTAAAAKTKTTQRST